MPDNYARRRFALPAVWEPADLWCVTIWIPGHVDYLDTLTGHLTDLGNSKNFERDATKTGAAIVARQWRRALDFEPPRIGNCAQPVNSPVLTTTAEKADYAAAIIYFMQHALLEPIVTCASGASTCDTCVDSLMSSLAGYGSGPAMRSALMGVCAAVKNAPGQDIVEALADCVYHDEFADLRDNVVGDGYDWLNRLSGALFGWLNETATEIFNALNNAAGVIGGYGIEGWISDHGGPASGGGAGFGESCNFTHTFGPGGELSEWFAASGFGTYDGTKWNSVNGGGNTQILALRINFPATSITSVRALYSATDIGNGGTRGIYINGGLVEPLNEGAGSFDTTWNGGYPMATQIQVEPDILNPPGAAHSEITMIVVEGLGVDPF